MPIGGNERDRLELLIEVASTIDLTRVGRVALDGLRQVHGVAGAAIFLRVGRGEPRIAVLVSNTTLPPGITMPAERPLPSARSLAPGESELAAFAAACDPPLPLETVDLLLPLAGDEEIDGFVALRALPWGERRHLERLGGALNRALCNSWRLARARRLSHERRVLLDLQRHVTASLRIEEVIERLLDSLADLVPFDAAAIFLLQPESNELQPATARGFSDLGFVKLKTTQGIAGLALERGSAVLVPEVAREARYVEARGATRSSVAIPLTLAGAQTGVLVLESDAPATYRAEHAEVLASVAAQAAVAIENARLHTTEVEAEALRRELKTARGIQRGLLPRRIPQPVDWEIQGANFPSLEMSGDLYDGLEVDGRLALVVGDVMGKGAPAAMLAATLHASVRDGLRQSESDLAEVVAGANRLLCRARMAHARFSSLFVGLLDPNTGTLEYVNAGHDPPLAVGAGGELARLDSGGLVLGVLPDARYQAGRVDLEPGSLLLLYTDGVTETTSPIGEEFGVARLERFLADQARPPRPLHRTLRALLARLRHHRAGAARADDITLLGARRRG